MGVINGLIPSLKSRPSINNMSDNYTEETTPLFKLLRTEAFRFVIVRFNHYSFLQQLETDLKIRFPDRPISKISAAKATYREIIDAYFGLARGFFFLQNFEDVLKEERNSLGRETEQMTQNNERRRQITAGLNLRRDKLAQSPIALFVFVPATTGELYAKTIMEKMPDLWSFRSFMLDLEKEIPNVFTTPTTTQSLDLPFSQLPAPDHTELQRLLTRLEKTAETEIPYRLSLFPQIVQQAMDVGETELAYTMLEAWEKHAYDKDKPTIWILRGDVLLIHGDIQEALNVFEKAKTLAQQVLRDKHLIAISYEKLGETHTALGDLKQALKYFELETNLFIELYDAFPNNVSFKNGLAISYSKLGETHSALGDLKQALTYFELDADLSKELYDTFPNNVRFKNGLAISYFKLGVFYRNQKQSNQARPYFEQAVALWAELVQDAPLVVAYQRFLTKARNDLAALGAA
ncbi:MAG: tetratricopeptide repeat protein [Rhodothermia bacterium]|nr:tetratricopeptide repeat protein [Rhodothermia bacterium]